MNPSQYKVPMDCHGDQDGNPRQLSTSHRSKTPGESMPERLYLYLEILPITAFVTE